MSSCKIKGFKVTNADRSRTIGLACKSLDHLLTKACDKFQVDIRKSQLYLQDGTIIDEEDYFETVPSQTCLILVQAGQRFLTGADIIYNALCAVNIETIKFGDSVKGFFDDNVKKKIATLSRLITRDELSVADNSHLSSRDDDPSWFQGLDTSSKTKEAFMRRRCSERMRGYLYKAEKDIKSHPTYSEMRKSADLTISSLKSRLAANMHMGYYFDRSDSKSICNSDGNFKCDGLWNRSNCESSANHTINPYSNRERRIVFSTWNLDHRIEKSREIVPALIKACLEHSFHSEEYEINLDYFFSLLFTTSNLRLVHIVCHDKAAHSTAKCNPKLALIDKRPKETSKGVKRKLSDIDNTIQSISDVRA